jgi:hypothetical protein
MLPIGGYAKVVISQIFKLGVIKKFLGLPVKSPTRESKTVLIQPRSRRAAVVPCVEHVAVFVQAKGPDGIQRSGKISRLAGRIPEH